MTRAGEKIKCNSHRMQIIVQAVTWIADRKPYCTCTSRVTGYSSRVSLQHHRIILNRGHSHAYAHENIQVSWGWWSRRRRISSVRFSAGWISTPPYRARASPPLFVPRCILDFGSGLHDVYVFDSESSRRLRPRGVARHENLKTRSPRDLNHPGGRDPSSSILDFQKVHVG